MIFLKDLREIMKQSDLIAMRANLANKSPYSYRYTSVNEFFTVDS